MSKKPNSGSSGIRFFMSYGRGAERGQLAALANNSVKKSKEEITAALQGNWKDELLYQLQDKFEIYQVFQEGLRRCDKQIEVQLESMIDNFIKEEQLPELAKKKVQSKQIEVNVSN